MSSKHPLTKEGIIYLLQQEPRILPIRCSIILQVNSFRSCPYFSNSKSFFTITLSDNKYKYNGFIAEVPLDNKMNPGDIIKLAIVSIKKLNPKAQSIFLIKKFNVLKKKEKLNKNLTLVTPREFKKFYNKRISIEEYDDNDFDQYVMDFIGENMMIEKVEEVGEPKKEKEKEPEPDLFLAPPFMRLSKITTFTKNLVIYVQVISKNEKTFFNSTTLKESHLASINFIDPYGFEMQGVLFDKAYSKFAHLLKEGEIYLIEGGNPKLSNKKYTAATYTIAFDVHTKITHIDREKDRLFKEKLLLTIFEDIPFTRISELHKCDINVKINCCVYVINAHPSAIISTKTGKKFKRAVVGDVSLKKCEFTLWEECSQIKLLRGDMLVLKGMKIYDYKGIGISSVLGSVIIVNPEEREDEQQELKELRKLMKNDPDNINWEDISTKTEDTSNTAQPPLQETPQATSESVTHQLPQKIFPYYPVECRFDRVKVKQIDALLGEITPTTKNPVLSKIKGTVFDVIHGKRNVYQGCPTKGCRRKLTLKGEEWFCDGCQKVFEKPCYYYSITLKVKDATAYIIVDLFGEAGLSFFGTSPSEYIDILKESRKDKIDIINKRVMYKTFFFLGKGNFCNYNNFYGKKFFSYRYEPVNEVDEYKRLLDNARKALFKE